METILITYGTRPFAQRVGRMLSSHYQLVYASSEPFPEILQKQHYHRIPTGSNPTFAHEVLKLCLDKGCHKLLPLGKIELQLLQEARILFEEYGITVLMPDDVTSCFFVEDPSEEVRVVQAGKDVLTDAVVCESHFSGAGILSDSGEDPLLCLV